MGCSKSWKLVDHGGGKEDNKKYLTFMLGSHADFFQLFFIIYPYLE